MIKRKSDLASKMKESIIDRHFFNQTIDDFKEPTNDFDINMKELQKHLEFEQHFHASSILNKIFIGLYIKKIKIHFGENIKELMEYLTSINIKYSKTEVYFSMKN